MALKYKIGDKVRIKSLDWYYENKDENGNIRYKSDNTAYPIFFSKYMSNFCGEILTIKCVYKRSYYMKETGSCEFWTDEMIECKVEEETKPEPKFKVGDFVFSGIDSYAMKIINRCYDEHWRYQIFDDVNEYWFFEKELKKIEIGDVVYSKVWKEKVIVREFCDDKFILVVDFKGKLLKSLPSLIKQIKEEEETKPKDMGEVSDGYHTFNELYEYRMLYNAALFNEFAKQGLYDVHKSRKHSDGEYPFGDSNWFIVMAELPTGQISNHYEIKDWDKFQIPEKPLANKWDEHSPKDVANRLTCFTTPKKEYPKTYEECCKIMQVARPTIWFDYDDVSSISEEGDEYECHIENTLCAFRKLLICRDAYWKIAGEEMGLGKPWEPDWREERYIIYRNQDDIIGGYREAGDVEHHIFEFPIIEMRDAFKENFDPDIEICKELL